MAKKLKGSRAKFSDTKWMGPEPSFKELSVVTPLQLTKAYSWYNHFYDNNDSKEFVIEYLKINQANKNLIKKINSVKPYRFSTVGWICRMLMRGAKLSKETLDYKEKLINDLLSHQNEHVEKQEEIVPENIIQERITEKSYEIIGEIETQIDLFIKNGYETKFRLYDWLQKNNIKAPIAKKIAEYYKDLKEELSNALNGNDEQLREAYSELKRIYLKKYYDFISSMITDCIQFTTNAKNTRKPRKKKIKSAEQLVAKLQYQRMDKTHKINSINPVEIVGARTLYVFNTKTRKLGLYIASEFQTLNIKGTTIQNFDEAKSIQLKLRKPEKILFTVQNGGAIAIRKIVDSINAKPSKLTGRINQDTILLRAMN